MKKQILATALLSGLILVTFVPAASALDKTADTKGSVQFEKVGENEVGEVVKPDTEDKPENIIVPEGGGNTTGPLRLQHVPDIKFGTVTFKTGNTKHQAGPTALSLSHSLEFPRGGTQAPSQGSSW